ncbi:hypothetical protein [Nonomuraea typhae]|uniref:hypothetical protein n=1 Tax=Nonomuraea typhae TaxID=2603600 RepID=UPI0012F7FA20|nr:hypothetical protein [Nonomuraea typhae]
MNPGSQFEPPTNPYRGPYEQPTMPPAPQPPRRRGRGRLIAAVAGAVVVVLVAGAAVLVLTGRLSPLPGGQPGGARSSAPVAKGKPAAPPTLDVCAMVPKTEAERLVPGAPATGDSRDAADSGTVTFTCSWVNRRISYNEFWRSRELDIRVEQHKGEGAKTGRAMAQSIYELDYGGAKYRETAKPESREDEKEYISPMREIQGVGEGAFAQYTWRRSGDLLWYSFGEAQARNGDMTVKIKFQASQQPKDAKMLSNEGTKSITEENALREVTQLLTHVVKGVSTWQAANPDVLARAKPKPTATPTPAPSQPSASPTVLAAFPVLCEKVSATALQLVPEGEKRARALEEGKEQQTECRWLNRELPLSGGGHKLRSALVTVHEFADRAGGPDQGAAKGMYAQKRGANQDLGFGGIFWGKMAEIKGLGDAAFHQYVTIKKGDIHSGTGTIVLRRGATVLVVDYSGVDVPKGATADSGDAKLVTEQEGRAGALKLARALADALAEQPTGS